MEEISNMNGSENGSPPVPPVAAVSRPSVLRRIFIGPNGLRAGWRLAIYIGIAFVILRFVRFVRGPHRAPKIAVDTPIQTIWREWLGFAIFGFSAWVMSRLEKVPWGNYGLPWRSAFRSRFWIGGLMGFAGLSCVMGGLRLTHCYYIDGLALHGSDPWKYAGLWLVGFVGLSFAEEFVSRGYGLYTIASGIGFWWAALFSAALFTCGHFYNSGETFFGLVDVFLFGMLACFIWWRTGDLWLAIGFHAFWDWGLSFFYSVPDSGIPALGHLFNVRVRGPAWLSGGSAGPEGSVINVVFDLLYFAIIAVVFPRRRFIGMNDHRLGSDGSAQPQPTVVIDTSALKT